MKVLHFAKSPMAGAPIRLVQALQRFTDLDVRLVDLERNGRYGRDLVFSEDRELVVELAEQADVIHFHNYLDYASTDFAPIDFDALRKAGKRLVRQFHSTPQLVARRMNCRESDVLNDPVPKLVIAQFQERYYPTARVVPNIVSETDPLYLPGDAGEYEWDILFSPSLKAGAWECRWNTKGLPETRAVMREVAKRTGCRINIVTDSPLPDLMKMKRRARILIDELVTGSYHLSGLEGLCLGRPVLAYLDSRTERVLREVSGADECPFVNVHLDGAATLLESLLEDRDRSEELGRAGRAWIERHWSARSLVQHFVSTYEDLLEDPGRIRRQEALSLDTAERRFQAIELPDRAYAARRADWRSSQPLARRAAAGLRSLRRLLARCIPRPIKGLARAVLGRRRQPG